MTLAAIWAVLQVSLIDVVLSGDNAVIIGVLAASLPLKQRSTAILWGVIIAIVMRIVFSLGVFWLLAIPGIMFIGGCLLVWIAAKMGYDLQHGAGDEDAPAKNPTTLKAAIIAISLADLSMSLDNVLGVAGAASGHMFALVFGLVLSMALMGAGATVVSRLIERHKWIAWIGLGLITFVAIKMLVHGVMDIAHWI